MSIRHVNTNCTRLHRTEQNRAEQSRTRTEQEQNITEQSRTEQTRTEQSRARTEQEQNRTIFYDARKVKTCLTYRYIQTYRDQYMLTHLEVSVYVYY